MKRLLDMLLGFSIAFLPNLNKKLQDEKIERGSIEEYCQEATSCFLLELGITAFLATTSLTSVHHAIAYGTFLDVFYIGNNLVNGKFKKFGGGVQIFMGGATVLVAICLFFLFTGKWHPVFVAKVLTILPAFKATYSYINPIGSGRRMLGKDISENGELNPW